MAIHRKEKRISGQRRGNTGQKEAAEEAKRTGDVTLYPEEKEALKDSRIVKGVRKHR